MENFRGELEYLLKKHDGIFDEISGGGVTVRVGGEERELKVGRRGGEVEVVLARKWEKRKRREGKQGEMKKRKMG